MPIPTAFLTRLLHRTLLLSTALASLLSPLRAQDAATGAIRGVVINDAAGNYVQGARLSLTGTACNGITDTQGRFLFGALPHGDYRIRAESVGNDAGELTVYVTAGATIPATLRLGSEVIDLEKLMVTGQAEGQAQALSPRYDPGR
ncbi:MAG: carboxypeptidase regulatory-like domain-containing protein [Undibacterium sp.]|nr:carboxypeptidase regulatory-like domain-containing protein [Opitutaceae bacterium]